MANVLVESFKFGPVAPFDAAAVVLTLGGLIIASSWTENFGDASDRSSVAEGFKKAGALIWNGARGGTGRCLPGACLLRWRCTLHSPQHGRVGSPGVLQAPPKLRSAPNRAAAEPKIALLGAMQSLFEAAMYTFVFLWTPALRCSPAPPAQAVTHSRRPAARMP